MPPDGRKQSGDAAEEAACEWLSGRGMRVERRNFRARGGEIDIVARQGDILVFAEVRFREGEEFGSPEETIGPAKRRRVIAAAREYLSRLDPSTWREARFDVVAVVGTGPAAVIRHYPGAFDARGKLL